MAYEIGATYVGMKELSDLTVPVPDPKSDFQDYSQYITLGNNKVRGAGVAIGEWRWTYLERTTRDQLKTFCTAASADVYIKTRKNDNEDAYQLYTATMIWPMDEEKSFSRRMDFVIKFTNAEEYTP